MDTSNQHGKELSEIWDEVADRVISRMLELFLPDVDVIHIDLRGELILALAKMRVVLASTVAQNRTGDRHLSDINIKTEREDCLGPAGLERIENSARNLAEAWQQQFRKRWRPKSLAALQKEKAPPKPQRRSPKEVSKNHYIAKAFIRDHWSTAGRIKRWRKNATGEYLPSPSQPFGKWGHARGLYSDKLEDYFGLVEGDATRPIAMLLASEPLNNPQRQALVGFLMIQQFRNPAFLSRLKAAMKPIVKAAIGEHRSEDDNYMQAVYETLFTNNDFYDRIARPVFWNTWVLLKSKGHFVLPDTWGVLRSEPEPDSFYCAPLTPSVCFLSLPPREEQKRVLPITLEIGPGRAAQINEIMIGSSTREFLSDVDFKGFRADHAQKCDGTVIDWIMLNIARVNREVGEWV
jgi:hypothetical protein